MPKTPHFKGSIRGAQHAINYTNGTKASGLDFYCTTSQGAVSLRLYRRGSEDMLEISLEEHNGHSDQKPIYKGPLDATKIKDI